jgi:NadR type nicotinamide-nucleotide adenylyltransferase
MAQSSDKIKRIALIGPECTGKSTLAKELATHYNTVSVAEYARQYCEQLKRPYTIDDIEYIARKQLIIEQEFITKANKFIFSDTELIISKVWADDVFKTVPHWIAENIRPAQYDLYLLMFPDITWQNDTVRENGNRREYFFDKYKTELENIDATFYVISGFGMTRFKNAVNVINKYFN